MVSLYFGLPGCGKTTFLTYFALRESKRLLRGKSRYKHIYSNVPLLIDGVTYIDNDCVGKYNLCDCLVLIDEATLFADSRDYKNFKKSTIEYFLEHRHFRADILLFTQQWDGVDRKIRTITDRVYYVTKGRILGRWISKCYRIPYDIIIPDRKHDQGTQLGEIIQGYAKPSFLTRLLTSKRIFRPRFYKFFDSFACPYRPELPSEFKTYWSEKGKKLVKKLVKRGLNKSSQKRLVKSPHRAILK